MSYSNPAQTEISSIGLDAVITVLQAQLKELSWIRKVFHRAYTHREEDANQQVLGRSIFIPKVWDEGATAGNEWYDCRPNDIVISQSFFTSLSEERVIEFEKHSDPTFEQDIALIVWVNTEQLPGHDSGPSLGYQKARVLEILKSSDSVLRIGSIVDRSATEIYEGFTINDEKTHVTMLPYAGFRINFTVKFDYIECLAPSS